MNKKNNPFRASGTYTGLSYIRRSADEKLFKAIKENQRYPYCLAPRQSGKSSLLVNTINKLDTGEFQSVFIDLSILTPKELSDFDQFLRFLSKKIQDTLSINIKDRVFIELSEIIKLAVLNTDKRVLIFIDEIDTLLLSSFKDLFFSQVRSIFNERSRDISLNRIQFILAGVAQPTELISSPNMSPFNVGIQIGVEDLTENQVNTLTNFLGLKRTDNLPEISSRIFFYTKGAVYLTQLILERLWEIKEGFDLDEIITQDVDKAVGQIINEASNNVHFLNIYNQLQNNRELLHNFLLFSTGKEIDVQAIKALEMIGITDGIQPFRNLIYKTVFGHKKSLSLIQENIDQMLVNATDLTSWANSNIATSNFIQLIQKLLISSIKPSEFASFTESKTNSIRSWLGISEVTEGNNFVPTGKTIWVLGTNKQVGIEAEALYNEKKNNKLYSVHENTTYIFITPRKWNDKNAWMIKHRVEGLWKEVKAYDVDDLELWLESYPGVHIWFSLLLDKNLQSAIDISTYWSNWVGVTKPVITPDLIMAGRNESKELIYKRLNEPPSLISLQANTREEALVFFAATLQALPERDREYLLSRCIVVRNLLAWKRLINSETPLILVADFEDIDEVINDSNHKHHFVFAQGKTEIVSSQSIVIPSPSRENIKSELIKMGFNEVEQNEKLNSLATLAKRNFLALRRVIAINPKELYPLWANEDNAKDILPFLLVGKWVDSNDADKGILERLSGTSNNNLEKILNHWVNKLDSPFRHIGNTWFLTSIEESWELLAKFLTSDLLKKFEAIFIDVFTTINPALELPPTERWRSNIFGEIFPYSDRLRDGMAESLAIMGSWSENIKWQDETSAQSRVNDILTKTFSKAHKTGKLWSSFASYLPLLAEASPEVFLAAVEDGINITNPFLMDLFSESDKHFFGSGSQHHHLLWALEILAWNREYLTQSSLLLAKLSRLDPGGKTTNRPDNSLRGIFLGWYPQTNANLEERLSVIDLMRQQEDASAWKLMDALLPQMHGIAHPNAKPKWREWNILSEPSATYAEIWQLTKEIVSRMLADVGLSSNRWKNLIAALGQVPKEQYESITNQLKSLNVDQFNYTDRLAIWETLRGTVSHHRDFPEAKWAMSSDMIDELEKIYEKFTPDDVTDKYAWLFAYQVKLINPPVRDHKNWQIREKVITEQRVLAVKEIYVKQGFAAILKTAQKSQEPHILGHVLGRTELIINEENELIDNYISSSDPKLYSLTFGFISGRFQLEGLVWAKTTLNKKAPKWTPEQIANFLLPLPFEKQTWDLLESFKNSEAESSYWSRVNPVYGYNFNYEYAVRKLISYKRPQIAIDFLALFAQGEESKVSPALVLEVLESLITITAEHEIQWGDIGYDLSVLMKVIRDSKDIDESRIAQLEWYYFPLLEQYGEGASVLYRELAQNPDFFVDLVKTIFKSENEEMNEQSKASDARITTAYRLMNSWHTCPGQNSDGDFDKDILQNWVSKAHIDLINTGRGTIGDQQIGQALAESPIGTDGAFPHEYVREIFEEFSNPEMERGFEVRVFNNRGVTTRGMTEGGIQERSIAQRYLDYANKIVNKSPRTAAMLQRIAEGYLDQAAREDRNAELTEELWQ